MNHLFVSEETADLLVIVERLSTQDQHRIVRLIHLLAQSPDAVRKQAQRMLRELIASEPETRADCLGEIDRIIARVECTLELDALVDAEPEGPRAVADRAP